MNNAHSKHYISGLMALLLFAVFAVSVLSVLLAGTQVYQRLSDRDDTSYSSRTAVQYLCTKVRQSDQAGAIDVASFCGRDALLVSQELQGELFLTRIYCHDGYLCELFSPASVEALPEYGEPLLPLNDMELHLEDGLLQVSMEQADGSSTAFSLMLRSSGEDTP